MISERKKAEAFLLAKHLTSNPNQASQGDIAKGVGICLSMILVLLSEDQDYMAHADAFGQVMTPDEIKRQIYFARQQR